MNLIDAISPNYWRALDAQKRAANKAKALAEYPNGITRKTATATKIAELRKVLGDDLLEELLAAGASGEKAADDAGVRWKKADEPAAVLGDMPVDEFLRKLESTVKESAEESRRRFPLPGLATTRKALPAVVRRPVPGIAGIHLALHTGELRATTKGALVELDSTQAGAAVERAVAVCRRVMVDVMAEPASVAAVAAVDEDTLATALVSTMADVIDSTID
jgi:hypothetical protein